MTKKERQKLRKWEKEIAKEIEIYHRVRSTPFSYNRVGKLIKPTVLTDKDIKLARRKWAKEARKRA